jgi:hypothetical protein
MVGQKKPRTETSNSSGKTSECRLKKKKQTSECRVGPDRPKAKRQGGTRHLHLPGSLRATPRRSGGHVAAPTADLPLLPTLLHLALPSTPQHHSPTPNPPVPAAARLQKLPKSSPLLCPPPLSRLPPLSSRFPAPRLASPRFAFAQGALPARYII